MKIGRMERKWVDGVCVKKKNSSCQCLRELSALCLGGRGLGSSMASVG